MHDPGVARRRTLTVGCTAGLCNRLMVLVSGMALAKASGRSFRMLWPRTPPCAASFAELFANDWNVEECLPAAENELADYGDGLTPPMPDLLTAGDRDLSARGCGWLVRPERFSGHEGLRSSCRE